MAAPAYLSDKNKKVIYMTWKKVIASYVGYKAFIRGLGTEPMKTGGYNSTFMLQLSNGGSSGFLGSSNSVQHIGEDSDGPLSANRQTIAMTHTTLYARTVIDHRRVRDYEISGDIGNFLNEELENQRDTFAAHEQMWNSLLFRGANGKLAVVTETASAISDGASGDVAVDGVQFIPTNTTVGVVRSGSVQSVKLVCTAQKTNGVGGGTMTFKNVTGSGSYTPTAADIFIPYNAYEQCFIEGIDADIGSSAYPTNQANNVQLDNALYKSVVLSGGNAKLNPQHLRVLKRQVGNQLPASLAGQMLAENKNTGQMQSPFVFLMAPSLTDQLAKDFYAKRRDLGYAGEQLDPGWGFVNTFEGVPVVPEKTLELPDDSSGNPQTSVYFVYGPGFGSYFSDPMPITSGAMGVYQNIPRTNLFEATYEDVGAMLCVQRSSQGKLTNVGGLSVNDINS